MGSGNRHNQHLDDYLAWRRSFTSPWAFEVALVDAVSDDRFGQVNPGDVADNVPTFVYALGTGDKRLEYDFGPFLAEYDGSPRFVKAIQRIDAFSFLTFLKRGGTDDYYDDRVAIAGDGTPVHAQDILDGSWPPA